MGQDSVGLQVPIQYCLIEKLVNYLPLEELWAFHLLDKRTNDYASNADFYRFLSTSKFAHESSWRIAFFRHMATNDIYRLKVAYCYAFGFPSHFFLQEVQQHDCFQRYEFKRHYYSGLPSQEHLYRIAPVDQLRQTINAVDNWLYFDQHKGYFFLAIAYYHLRMSSTLSLEEQKRLLREKTKGYCYIEQLDTIDSTWQLLNSIRATLETAAFDFLMLKRYFLSLSIALPTLIKDCDLLRKEYWYEMIMHFPYQYRNAVFILLFEQYQRQNIVDALDANCLARMHDILTGVCRRERRFGIFSSRFFSHLCVNGMFDNTIDIETKWQYIQNLLSLGIVHTTHEAMLIFKLTQYVFNNQHLLFIGDKEFNILNKCIARGLSLFTWFQSVPQEWFWFVQKVFWMRYWLDTNQSKKIEDFTDVQFLTKVLNQISNEYQEVYWVLWRQCAKKQVIKREK